MRIKLLRAVLVEDQAVTTTPAGTELEMDRSTALRFAAEGLAEEVKASPLGPVGKKAPALENKKAPAPANKSKSK